MVVVFWTWRRSPSPVHNTLQYMIDYSPRAGRWVGGWRMNRVGTRERWPRHMIQLFGCLMGSHWGHSSHKARLVASFHTATTVWRQNRMPVNHLEGITDGRIWGHTSDWLVKVGGQQDISGWDNEIRQRRPRFRSATISRHRLNVRKSMTCQGPTWTHCERPSLSRSISRKSRPHAPNDWTSKTRIATSVRA